jgi:drug/metabolite transporter (DMT)-like permease
MLGNSKSSDEQSSLYGLLLALGAVFMDGFVGSSQEKITRLYKPSASLLMSSVHVWGIIISGTCMFPVCLF